MAGNTVEINVGARDEGATANLEALKARLDEIGRKNEHAKVSLDGVKQSDLDAAKLQVRLDRLNKMVANPRIKPEGIDRAIAEMIAVQHEMDKLKRKADEAAAGNFFRRMISGFSSLGKSMGGVMGKLPLIGGMFKSLGNAGVAAAPLIAGVATALAAVAVALGPLVAGLGAVTIGFAAFAAGAVGEIKKVITAHQALAAAQAQYAKATTAKGRLAALAAEKRAVDGLSASEKLLLGDLHKLSGDFGKLQTAIRPEVVRGFGTALDIIRKLMPTITPLAVAAGRAIDGFLTRIDNWLSSPSGKKFLTWLGTEGPKAIDTFGKALWNITAAVGQVLYWWDRLGNDVIKSMNVQGQAVLQGVRYILIGLRAMVDGALWAFGTVVSGAEKVAASLGLKGLAGNLQQAGSALAGFKSSADTFFNAAIGKVGSWQQALARMPKVVKIQGDIADLSNKLAIARANLAATTNPVRRARIQADISQLLTAIAVAKAQLAGLNGATATVFVKTVKYTVGAGATAGALGFAHGGVIGAATGGPRSRLTLVGEHGPEILDLPPGTRVHSNPDTQRMLAGASRGGGTTLNVTVNVPPSVNPRQAGQEIAETIKAYLRGGGTLYPAGMSPR